MSTLLEIQPTATRERPQDLAHDPAQDVRAVATHQTLAVVCALVFFRPLGIAAVVQAGHVRTRLALGDLEGARRASRNTLRLCWASAMATMFFVAVIALCADGYSRVH
ncbi:MAG TPA: CD225/dispanin family protein [Nocardioides sp.]|nr:CD225/dispanin family protein [Nocardioides sp.]